MILDRSESRGEREQGVQTSRCQCDQQRRQQIGRLVLGIGFAGVHLTSMAPIEGWLASIAAFPHAVQALDGTDMAMAPCWAGLAGSPATIDKAWID